MPSGSQGHNLLHMRWMEHGQDILFSNHTLQHTSRNDNSAQTEHCNQTATETNK